MPAAALDTDAGDDAERHVLGRDADGERSFDDHGHGLWPALPKTLGGEHMLNLRGADPEGERSQGAVGRGVRVAADDQQPGLCEAELRTDDVNDALAGVAHAVQLDALAPAVLLERRHLALGHLIGCGPPADRGDVVIHRGDRQVGPADTSLGEPQTLERLRRRHLMNEVKVDIEQVRFAVPGRHHVVIPDLCRHRPRHYLLSASARTRSARSRSRRASASLRSTPVTSPIRRSR